MEPSDEELLGLMPQQLRDDLAIVARMAAHGAGPDVTPELFEGSLATGALQFARAALTRYGHQPAPPVAEGEVVKAVRPSRRQLIMLADDMGMASVSEAAEYARAVLARWGSTLTPVPVSERLPGPGDCDAEGLCWVWHTTAYTWGLFRLDLTAHSHWLPATALPLPAAEVQP